MDDVSRAADESLLRELECPVCKEYMAPPIELCTNGHNICSKCRETVQCCPTCTADFSDIRNTALENIARTQKYPCTNRQGGCSDLFSIEHIAEHHAVCVYGKIKCPFKINTNCSWNGFKRDLKEHAKAAHKEHLIECSTFRSALFGDRIVVLWCFGELFVYCSRIVDGRLYCAVQLIGTSSEASRYKTEFTLLSSNGIEKMSNTSLVLSYTEDWEAIFNSGQCLRLDDVTVRKFLVENELNLTVTLSRVYNRFSDLYKRLSQR
jgi:E3 ubiquitin-protein ligase SIAH1